MPGSKLGSFLGFADHLLVRIFSPKKFLPPAQTSRGLIPLPSHNAELEFGAPMRKR